MGCRGLSSVITGAGDLGDCFCCVLSRGRIGSERARTSVASVDLVGAEAFTDTLSSYAASLRAAGITAHNRFNSSEAAAD